MTLTAQIQGKRAERRRGKVSLENLLPRHQHQEVSGRSLRSPC
ncbi:hypothetical protein HMPREF1554_02310 [Porphyromonas gingivalis F0569]|nr:hypothetical protein HMPREF1554_02310 [Porphyromonas gingivalis F0569]